MIKDTSGRVYARYADLDVGDVIVLDTGFTCRQAGRARVLIDNEGLYFKCKEGKHYLVGQITEGGYLIGCYHG